MQQTVVVAQHIDADETQEALVEQIVANASQHGHCVIVVPDLYHLTDESTIWDDLRELPPAVTLWAWQHPRPLRWLLAQHDIDAAEWRLLDLRTIQLAHEAFPMPPPVPALEPGLVRRMDEPALARWYPVIDYDRCETCGHCQQFCLFGVYDRDAAQRVRVTQPDNCKPGCPACSRICPHGAIMFPLYGQDPAIAGAPGTRMSLDPAGRRMYYERTGAACPTCAQLTDEQLAHVAQDGACPECGRKLPEHSPVLAEIDALIDKLDRLSDGGEK